MSNRFPALLLLLALACTDERPQPDSLDSTLTDTVPAWSGDSLPLDDIIGESLPSPKAPRLALPGLLRAAIPPPTVDTVRTSTVDSTRVGDSLRYERRYTLTVTTTGIDSQWIVVRPSPAVVAGMPWGPYAMPADSFCAQLGYTATTTPLVRATAVAIAKRAKACGVSLGFMVPRRILQRSQKEGAHVAVNYLRDSIPAEVDRYVADGTVRWLWVGDDIARAEEFANGDPWPVQLATWDSIGRAGKLRWPAATYPQVATALRALPTQMRERRDWKWVDAAAVQYRGDAVRKQGTVASFFRLQADTAKALNLGLILGLNLLNGGCGPDPAACYQNKVLSADSQLVNIRGVNLRGTQSHLWALSAEEFLVYARAALREPAACAFISWSWSLNWKNHPWHTRPDIQATAKRIALLAARREPASCHRR